MHRSVFVQHILSLVKFHIVRWPRRPIKEHSTRARPNEPAFSAANESTNAISFSYVQLALIMTIIITVERQKPKEEKELVK